MNLFCLREFKEDSILSGLAALSSKETLPMDKSDTSPAQVIKDRRFNQCAPVMAVCKADHVDGSVKNLQSFESACATAPILLVL